MIRISELTKRYSNEVQVGPIDLELPPGGITALVGPNGAGKSTLLTMMGRLTKADSGTVHIDEVDVQNAPSKQVAKLVSVLRQENHFVTRLTVRQLVGFGRHPYSGGRLTGEDEEAISSAIDFLGLNDLEQRFLDELSGGQRQRAYVAMVLAQDTPYMLLDEPLNNLDAQHSVQMMQMLQRACHELGRTIVIVLHDINFAASYADFIVAMDAGMVTHAAHPDELITDDVLSQVFRTPVKVVHADVGRFAYYHRVSMDVPRVRTPEL